MIGLGGPRGWRREYCFRLAWCPRALAPVPSSLLPLWLRRLLGLVFGRLGRGLVARAVLPCRSEGGCVLLWGCCPPLWGGGAVALRLLGGLHLECGASRGGGAQHHFLLSHELLRVVRVARHADRVGSSGVLEFGATTGGVWWALGGVCVLGWGSLLGMRWGGVDSRACVDLNNAWGRRGTVGLGGAHRGDCKLRGRWGR